MVSTFTDLFMYSVQRCAERWLHTNYAIEKFTTGDTVTFKLPLTRFLTNPRIREINRLERQVSSKSQLCRAHYNLCLLVLIPQRLLDYRLHNFTRWRIGLQEGRFCLHNVLFVQICTPACIQSNMHITLTRGRLILYAIFSESCEGYKNKKRNEDENGASERVNLILNPTKSPPPPP